jgi:hypothetical protein
VVQEYVTARDATFLYGGGFASRNVVSAVLLALYEDSFYITAMIQRIPSASEFHRLKLHELYDRPIRFDFLSTRLLEATFILDYQGDSSTTRNKDLIPLLTHSRNCGTSDKRDHVYAFLDLTGNVFGLVVDYSSDNTPQALFTQLAHEIVKKDKDLQILA